jgi:hypothetical protein
VLLLITEANGGWPEGYPLKSKKAEEIGGCLFHYFAHYIIPRRISGQIAAENF